MVYSCPSCNMKSHRNFTVEIDFGKCKCTHCGFESYLPEFMRPEPGKDMVSSPAHYADHYPFEVCEAIDLLLDHYGSSLKPYEVYCLGNELKYRLRAGFKEPDKIEQDIKKALWYNKSRREG